MAKLRRKQVYLDENSDRALKRLAVVTKISEAEHIRRALKSYLETQTLRVRTDDPLRRLLGLCDSPDGPADASVHHDRYLYGKKA